MKKLILIFAFLSFAFIFSGCGTTAPVQQAPVQAEEITPAEEVVSEPEVIAEPEEVIPEEPEVVEVVEEIKTEDEEYHRSTTNVSVTKETFEEDKARILKIIEDLDIYMKNRDFKGWVSYLDAESYQYWSKKPNLSKAAQRLPKKGLRLNSIEDYFKFVFIPARRGHTVDEIRYDTETEVNVVQVDDDKDIVYYNFQKVNDKWRLVLPKNPS